MKIWDLDRGRWTPPAELRAGSSPKAWGLLAPCKQRAPRERPGPGTLRGKAGCLRHGVGSDPAFPPHVQLRAAKTPPRSGLGVLAHGGDHGRGEPRGLPLSGRKLVACFATVQPVSMTNVRCARVPVPPRAAGRPLPVAGLSLIRRKHPRRERRPAPDTGSAGCSSACCSFLLF